MKSSQQLPVSDRSLVVVLGLTLVTGLVGSRQALWLKAIERRLDATNSTLNDIKNVKMCGLSAAVETDICNLRREELRIAQRSRRLLIWNMLFGKLITI